MHASTWSFTTPDIILACEEYIPSRCPQIANLKELLPRIWQLGSPARVHDTSPITQHPDDSQVSLIRTVDTDKPVSQRLPSERPISRVSSDTTQGGLAIPTFHVLAALRQSSPLAWLFSFPLIFEPRPSPLDSLLIRTPQGHAGTRTRQAGPASNAFARVLGLTLGMFWTQAAISGITTFTPPTRLSGGRTITFWKTSPIKVLARMHNGGEARSLFVVILHVWGHPKPRG